MTYFPSKIEKKTKALVTYVHAGVCGLGEHVYLLDRAGGDQWKQKSHRIIDVCINQQDVSPDGKFKWVLETGDGSDLITLYKGKLVDQVSKDTMNLLDCWRRDLGRPNFYWSKDSRYLIFEKCHDSFASSQIAVFDLVQRRIAVELHGLVGNMDWKSNQFDIDHQVLIFFKATDAASDKIPSLYAFDLYTRQEKKLCTFNERMDMDFPQIARVPGKREVELIYSDLISSKYRKVRVGY